MRDFDLQAPWIGKDKDYWDDDTDSLSCCDHCCCSYPSDEMRIVDGDYLCKDCYKALMEDEEE